MTFTFTKTAAARAGRNLQWSGGSPFKRTDKQRITGAISTGRAIGTGVPFPVPNRRFEIGHRCRPAGVDRPSPKKRTKSGRSTRRCHCETLHSPFRSKRVRPLTRQGSIETPLPHFPPLLTAAISQEIARNLQQGGGSPSKHKDTQRITGPISTGRADCIVVPFPVPNRRFEIAPLCRPAGVDRSSPGMRTKTG